VNLNDRAVLDHVDAWYESASRADAPDLYIAAGARRNEPCPYAPSTMWDDLQAQVDAEAKTRAERGEFLIDVELDTGLVDKRGRRISKPARYLDSNAP
jgi:hypothetical protein